MNSDTFYGIKQNKRSSVSQIKLNKIKLVLSVNQNCLNFFYHVNLSHYKKLIKIKMLMTIIFFNNVCLDKDYLIQ